MYDLANSGNKYRQFLLCLGNYTMMYSMHARDGLEYMPHSRRTRFVPGAPSHIHCGICRLQLDFIDEGLTDHRNRKMAILTIWAFRDEESGLESRSLITTKVSFFEYHPP
jgi:hypothetical protein